MSSQSFIREAEIMKTCDHRNLVKLLAVSSKEESLFIVCEFMCNGSLLDFFRTADGRNMPLETATEISAQVQFPDARTEFSSWHISLGENV